MGNFIEISQKPQWQSVEQYRKHLRKEAPNYKLSSMLFEPDIECTCCTQGAPSEAAALIKVEDQTPVNEKFKALQGNPNGNQGTTLWICADCFINGVRPKYTYFGDIRWNKQGKRIKRRADRHNQHPW